MLSIQDNFKAILYMNELEGEYKIKEGKLFEDGIEILSLDNIKDVIVKSGQIVVRLKDNKPISLK